MWNVCCVQVYSSSGSDLQDRKWLEHTLELVQPLIRSQGQLYNYFNCLPRDPWQTYFGPHAEQLQQIKAKYDPGRVLKGLNCQCAVSYA